MDSGSEDKREKNTDRPTSRMESLPREVALDIFSRLPVTSLMQCRSVSLSWQNLTCDRSLIDLHRVRTTKNNTCLIFHRCFPFGNLLHFVEFSDHNKKAVVRKFQTPIPTPMPQAEFNVVGSCNGMICLSYSKDHNVLQICNPFTRSYKDLPPSKQYEAQRVLVGFGFHPITNEYKVVKIVHYPVGLPVYGQSEVQVYSLGGNDWRSIGNIPYQIGRWSSEPILVNGRLHWLSRFGHGGDKAPRLISFDLADEQFREMPTPTWGGIMRYYYPLAVLGGCLSMLVYPCVKKLEIWVMKEYGVRESWSKDYEIDINGPRLRGTRMWTTSLQSLACQVLCLTKNGEILLMHDGALASYDPESKEVKNVMFEGMPDSFQALVHEGSLVWIENS